MGKREEWLMEKEEELGVRMNELRDRYDRDIKGYLVEI